MGKNTHMMTYMFGSSGHLPDIQANALFFLTQQNT